MQQVIIRNILLKSTRGGPIIGKKKNDNLSELELFVAALRLLCSLIAE